MHHCHCATPAGLMQGGSNLMGQQACILYWQHPGRLICLIHMTVPPAWGGGEGSPCLPWGLDGVNQVAILVNALCHGCVHTCQRMLCQPLQYLCQLQGYLTRQLLYCQVQYAELDVAARLSAWALDGRTDCSVCLTTKPSNNVQAAHEGAPTVWCCRG